MLIPVLSPLYVAARHSMVSIILSMLAEGVTRGHHTVGVFQDVGQ